MCAAHLPLLVHSHLVCPAFLCRVCLYIQVTQKPMYRIVFEDVPLLYLTYHLYTVA
jgi:hypothetical protein